MPVCVTVQGCMVRDHVVDLEFGDGTDKTRQSKVYEDLMAHRDAITVPYQASADQLEE